jgi:hypothetical protein
MSLKPLVLVAVVSFFLTGCGGWVQGTVTRFHSLSDTYSNATVTVLPANEAVADSLEFRTYRDKVATHLIREGFRVASEHSDSPSQLIALLNYGIDDGTTTTQSYQVPVWGQTGVSSSTTTGSVNTYGNYGSYSSTTYYQPTYGITGYTSGTTTTTEYKRVIHLDLFDTTLDKSNPEKIYESIVTSSGSCHIISEVIDEMFIMLFKDFRSPSGSSNKYTLEAQANC